MAPAFRSYDVTVNNTGDREAITVTGRCTLVEFREKKQDDPWSPQDYEVGDVVSGGDVTRRAAGVPIFFEPRKGNQFFSPGETIGYAATLTSSVTFERIEYLA